MPVDLVCNIHNDIKHMSLDRMAKYFGQELNLCCYNNNKNKRCSDDTNCCDCWEGFLQRNE